MSMASAKPTGHLLKRLRSLMLANSSGKVHAYIVPSGDAHQSEYIAECDMRRKFISKFSGSAGTAIITHDKAALWTDGRYHLQASQELELDNWILMKDGLPDTPTYGEWLKEVLQTGDKVGVDPMLISHESWKKLAKELKSRNITLVPVPENLIDIVWEDKSILLTSDQARPSRPRNALINIKRWSHGKDWEVKVKELREELRKKKASSIVLTALDDVAWLLNLRGSDIDYNPVFFAYCIVTMSEVILFVDKQKLTSKIETMLNAYHTDKPAQCGDMGVRILPYNDILDYIVGQLTKNSEQSIWVSSSSSEAVISKIPSNLRYMQPSPVTKAKAIKNKVEIENMKKCHVRDGAALCEYLAWLEKMIEANPNGHDSLWEIQGADYLENCRKQQAWFMGLSFPSISSSGPNGAIIHYHPSEVTRRPIGKDELYLIDSGAQYMDGTTDVTRTVHFGEPTQKQRECFTLVLKGHIRLGMAVFPRLIKGNSLDTFARQYLWAHGLEYLHGTGHGVGMFLNVHEGPSSISPRMSPNDPGLEAGQILSNEPGYYEDGEFGIRIENLVVTKEAETKYNYKGRGFLQFENLTLVPIQQKMIDVSMLTDDEINWLNAYHAECRKFVGAHLQETNKPEAFQWLLKETTPISRS